MASESDLRALVAERYGTILISANGGTRPRVHLPDEDGAPRCHVLRKPRAVDLDAVPNAPVCELCCEQDPDIEGVAPDRSGGVPGSVIGDPTEAVDG